MVSRLACSTLALISSRVQGVPFTGFNPTLDLSLITKKHKTPIIRQSLFLKQSKTDGYSERSVPSRIRIVVKGGNKCTRYSTIRWKKLASWPWVAKQSMMHKSMKRRVFRLSQLLVSNSNGEKKRNKNVHGCCAERPKSIKEQNPVQPNE